MTKYRKRHSAKKDAIGEMVMQREVFEPSSEVGNMLRLLVKKKFAFNAKNWAIGIVM